MLDKSIRNLLSATTEEYALINQVLRSYNPVLGSVVPNVVSANGIVIPLANSSEVSKHMPEYYRHDVADMTRKDGSQKLDVTVALLVTDEDKTIFYHLPYNHRKLQGNRVVGRTGNYKYVVPANVHTLIYVTTTFKRAPDALDASYYNADDVRLMIHTRDARFMHLKELYATA